MTRGKYAVRSDNRTSAQLQAEVSKLSAELKSVRESAKEKEDLLNLEIGHLRVSILAEASKLAAPEIKRHIDRVNEEHDKAGVSVQGMKNFMGRMDRFAFNACRYLSMTEGVDPYSAMDRVFTWITDEVPPKAVVDVDRFLIGNGLPMRGWVHQMLEWGFKSERKRWAKVGRKRADVVTLDYVDDHLSEFPKIHPDYDPKWYREWTDALGIVEEKS